MPLVKITFITKEEELIVEAEEGLSVLEIARQYDIDLEGACEGSMACSTCHVILDQKHFDLLPKAEEAEEDMLDLAFGLEKTSRLGCQIIISQELEGARFRLP